MNEIGKHISKVLKILRQKNQWSLDKASEQTGVSKAMLGQIERGESSPTIATLWKIATGFNTSFSSFVEDEQNATTQAIHRVTESYQLNPQDEKIRFKTLFPYDSKLHFEILIIELLPGCEHLSPAHQKGMLEHILVYEGSLEILVDDQWKKVKTGEGLRFLADKPHGYRNLSKNKAEFHDVIYYPY